MVRLRNGPPGVTRVSDSGDEPRAADPVVRRILAALAESGWTQRTLAKRVRIREDRISKWVKGVGVPTPAQLVRIAAAVGRPLEWFVQDYPEAIDLPRVPTPEEAHLLDVTVPGVGGVAEAERLILLGLQARAQGVAPPAPPGRRAAGRGSRRVVRGEDAIREGLRPPDGGEAGA